MAAPEIKKPAITVLALACSLALHAAAFAALLADWRNKAPEEPVLSVELVIVSAPIEAPAIDEAAAPAGAVPAAPPATAEPAAAPPEEAPAVSTPEPAPAPPQQSAPSESAPSETAPVAQPVPSPPASPPPPPPKPVKPQLARPAPQPTPPVVPRPLERPVDLNPGSIGGEETREARAPSGAQAPASFAVLHGPIPPYPAAARSRGQEGRVVLDVAIGTDGRPTGVTVASSSGAALLDEAAVATVKTWRFRNDSGRVLSVSVPIVFELRSTAGR